MIWDIVKQPWLPAASNNFRDDCKDLEQGGKGVSEKLMWLAFSALNTSQLEALSRSVKIIRQHSNPFKYLQPFKLAVLGSGTTCSFVPALTGAAYRYGLALEILQADYDQYVQSAVDPNSKINRWAPDAVLFALDARALNLHAFDEDEQAATITLDNAVQNISLMLDGIAEGCGSVPIFQTLPALPLQILGNIDNVTAGTSAHKITMINDYLRKKAIQEEIILHDTGSLAAAVGLDRWHDATKWNLYKIPFAQQIVPLYTDSIARLIAAIAGKSKKCLVLDLDNTLWGGVIGDDGTEGIVLGPGDAVGEAHLELQEYILSLKKRGVILAVSSKNKAENAIKVFREHPEMLIRYEDISVFQVNWENKASNIELIAKKLDLGLDSMVFLDDNPAERAQVRQELPMVAVPELPIDASYYARALSYGGFFESLGITEEDKNRTKEYQAISSRKKIQLKARDMTSYLESLAMKMDCHSFDAVGKRRVAQLINKSNQFNLTTRRYTEAEITALMKDSDVFTMQVRLSDSFGDNGMISVIICHLENSFTWKIDTWLMSCRVLGREVESAVLNQIVKAGLTRGIEQIIGEYIATEKNDLVRNHYKDMGFDLVSEKDLSSKWILDTAKYKERSVPIEIVGGYF